MRSKPFAEVDPEGGIEVASTTLQSVFRLLFADNDG